MKAIYMSKLASTLLERDSGATSRFSPFQQPHLMLLTYAKPVYIVDIPVSVSCRLAAFIDI